MRDSVSVEKKLSSFMWYLDGQRRRADRRRRRTKDRSTGRF